MKLKLFSFFYRSSTSDCNVTVVVGSSSHHNFTAGLFWDYENAVLLYVDRVRREIHRLNTCTGEDQFITLGKSLLRLLKQSTDQAR